MDFNFYWTVNSEEQDNSTLNELIQEIEMLLLDWENFFKLYAQFAPPPDVNKTWKSKQTTNSNMVPWIKTTTSKGHQTLQ